VYAFRPSTRAAQELGASIDATPHILHQVTALRFGIAEHQFDFCAGDVLVIDMASWSYPAATSARSPAGYACWTAGSGAAL
jgi:hypothetical protein